MTFKLETPQSVGLERTTTSLDIASVGVHSRQNGSPPAPPSSADPSGLVVGIDNHRLQALSILHPRSQ